MRLQTPRISVVVATFNRHQSLQRLLAQLSRQTLEDFEVRVVDDGSETPVRLQVNDPRFFLHRQRNSGAASARHAGALAARGDVLVFIDDDMEVEPGFLAAHATIHERCERAVVLGRIASDPAAPLPLFERWHAAQLDRLASDFAAGRLRPTGMHLYTGNASVRREDYVAVGGFDRELGHSEDAELGLRLEKAGCNFVFSEEARVVHRSDHDDAERWLQRAYQYGRYDTRIAARHPDRSDADPWRFVGSLHPALSPLIASAVATPDRAAPLARLSLFASSLIDRTPLRSLALAGTTAAFATQYFRGVRDELGSLRSAATALAKSKLRAGTLGSFATALRADHALMLRNEARYGHRTPSSGALKDAIERIGFQQMTLLRATRFLQASGLTLAAKIAARLSRHLYASDVHWEAKFAPGVMLVHGFGLAISHSAKIGPGCVLFQNVTLGMGRDATTGETGAPTLEANVSVGPGATLVGPITVGANSKIGPGVVLTRSVPPNSIVEQDAPVVRVRSRDRRDGGGLRVEG